MKKIVVIALFVLLGAAGGWLFAQDIEVNHLMNIIPDSLQQYTCNKIIPKESELPILTALSHYPELKNIHIIFRKVNAYTPLTTRPDFTSMFRRKNHRTYIVRMSQKTIDTLTPLLFYHLSFEQRVGVIGHELGHVADFDSKNFFQSLHTALDHLSQRYLDRMEFKTDKICIQHGLGRELLSFRKYLFEVMRVKRYWRGVDHVMQPDNKYERYMNPETIEKYMKEYGQK